jgi:hypothetical protein
MADNLVDFVSCEAVRVRDLQAQEFLAYNQGFPPVEVLGSCVPAAN